jgi:hypothetical protein
MPAANWYVSANALPRAPIPARPSERVALFPAFQPLSFEGKGSGTDPDAFVRAGAASPINEWFPSYPVDAALAYAERDGDYRYLAALGVSSIVERPYLRTDEGTLRDQRVDSPRRTVAVAVRERAHPLAGLSVIPLLSLRREEPVAVSLGDDPAENAVFFGDLRPDLIRGFTPSRATHEASRAWVDARLSASTHPENGSAFGGVLTSSRVALPLPLQPRAVASEGRGGRALLARVDGVLRDDRGRLVAASDARFGWHALASDARSVHCSGTCIVALAGSPPRGLPPHHLDDARAREALPVREITPWLAVATLPPGAGGTLRYNVRYDAHWLGYANGILLRHVRLDTIVNGWVAPFNDGGGERRLIFVEIVAAGQALLEIMGFAVLSVCLFSVRRKSQGI